MLPGQGQEEDYGSEDDSVGSLRSLSDDDGFNSTPKQWRQTHDRRTQRTNRQSAMTNLDLRESDSDLELPPDRLDGYADIKPRQRQSKRTKNSDVARSTPIAERLGR